MRGIYLDQVCEDKEKWIELARRGQAGFEMIRSAQKKIVEICEEYTIDDRLASAEMRDFVLLVSRNIVELVGLLSLADCTGDSSGDSDEDAPHKAAALRLLDKVLREQVDHIVSALTLHCPPAASLLTPLVHRNICF